MKRRDVAAIVVAAAVVGAAGMTDWSPKAIVVRAPAVVGEEAGEPERLHVEQWDYVRGIRWTGGRDLFRYVEKVGTAPSPRREGALTHAEGSTQVTVGLTVAQTTRSDGLSYFGFAKKTGVVRALFCDEEQVYVAKEGDVIGGRWRVIRIGVTAAEIEDLVQHTRETVTMVTS
jgi:hypothetical protein